MITFVLYEICDMDGTANDIDTKLRNNSQFQKRVSQVREVIGLNGDLLPDAKKYYPQKVSSVAMGATVFKMLIEPCYKAAEFLLALDQIIAVIDGIDAFPSATKDEKKLTNDFMALYKPFSDGVIQEYHLAAHFRIDIFFFVVFNFWLHDVVEYYAPYSLRSIRRGPNKTIEYPISFSPEAKAQDAHEAYIDSKYLEIVEAIFQSDGQLFEPDLWNIIELTGYTIVAGPMPDFNNHKLFIHDKDGKKNRSLWNSYIKLKVNRLLVSRTEVGFKKAILAYWDNMPEQYWIDEEVPDAWVHTMKRFEGLIWQKLGERAKEEFPQAYRHFIEEQKVKKQSEIEKYSLNNEQDLLAHFDDTWISLLTKKEERFKAYK